MKRLEEHDRKFEMIMAKLQEHDRKLEEHDKKLEAIMAKLEEHDRKLEEHDRRLEEHNRRLSRVELVVGALAEAFYARSLWEDLREEIRGRGEEIVHRERNAYVDGEEVDLLILTNKTVYIVEVKTKPRKADISSLLSKANTASKAYPDKTIVPVLAGSLISRELAQHAENKGIRVVRY